ncbi:copper homeostasis membrane protein CopD [Budvicia diplopodorum]|uniref:copper homeostasis membrane protein CopD n=1 Tax=Budvicia diplopodorum TaxID=1119056 RepID=UPI00135B7B5B|nr:copper homeostasis membrane protein CopD [Budvicia diplopodorum]
MSLTALLILGRLLHFSSVMLMFGISIFVVLLTPIALKSTLHARLNRVLSGTISVNLLTAIAIFAAQSGLMGSGWPDTINPAILYAVLSTTFGAVWQWQLTFAIAAGCCLFLRPQCRFNAIVWLSTALLINLGFVGHVTINTGLLGALHRLNHAIHLLSGGYWIGTLIPLLVCFGYLSDPKHRSDAIRAMTRFSAFGHIAVLLVIATGMINTAMALGTWPIHWSSPYQQLLSIKVALVMAMVAIALYNRYVLVPQIKPDANHILQRFTLCTVLEIITGVVVLALVSVFATQPPA